ncbi:hypothetical protein [Actinoplanes octamycinicus]|uniref:hypothetical protein n=1 Tax=Actinoplanes octamycinicus TaxID=135948 RepID=UPI0031F05CD9
MTVVDAESDADDGASGRGDGGAADPDRTTVITQGSGDETTTVIPSPGPDQTLIIDNTEEGDRTQVVSLPTPDQRQSAVGHPDDDDPTIPSRPTGT